jgi:tRNA uridine 5-carboxymethylaminomethyl modification enzyme
VLIDDLITKDAREPYRMFTSRAEYRLMLRQDNADLRLMGIGYKLGLIGDEIYSRLVKKREQIEHEVKRLHSTRPSWTPELRNKLALISLDGVSPDLTLAQLLRRQDMTYERVLDLTGEIGPADDEVMKAVETEVKYDGYIKRQGRQIHQFKKLEDRKIPSSFQYDDLVGFSKEVVEKLKRVRPSSIGQASRISGVTPAAISLLLVLLERTRRQGVDSNTPTASNPEPLQQVLSSEKIS